MSYYVQLPSQNGNAMVDFSGLRSGIRNLGQTFDDERLAKERADERAYERGRNAMADSRYADQLAYQRGRDKLADTRYADETAHARSREGMADARYQDELGYNRGREAKADARADEAYQTAKDDKKKAAIAGFVQQHIASDKDPASRAAKWQKFLTIHPGAASLPREYHDPQLGPDLLLSEATGVQDPLDREAKQANIDHTRAQTAKLDREETTTGPYANIKDRAGVEKDLRGEVASTNKEYSVIRDSTAKIEAIAQNPSPASDMALVFSFMKILDPASVVRETEYANAQNAAGVPERIQNLWNKVLDGEFLTPNQRQDFLNQAQTLAKTQRAQYDRSLNQYRSVAERLQVDPRNVILDDNPQPGEIPMAALEFLRSNRSPDVEQQFDQKYGAGAAQRALGGQ